MSFISFFFLYVVVCHTVTATTVIHKIVIIMYNAKVHLYYRHEIYM